MRKNKNDVSGFMTDWKEINFFEEHEFECSCCGIVIISKKLVLMLDLARELSETAFVITSGYRCKKHNKEVGGVRSSSHLKGFAVDIAVPDNITRLKILRGLIIAGFRRIGIGKDFIHVDIDPTKPNNIWLYK